MLQEAKSSIGHLYITLSIVFSWEMIIRLSEYFLWSIRPHREKWRAGSPLTGLASVLNLA